MPCCSPARLAAVVLPSVISSGSDTDVVAVVAAPPEFRAALEQARSGDDVQVRFVEVNDRAAARRQVDDGDADIAVIGGEPPSIVVTAGEHPSLVGAAQQALASSEVQANLRAAGLSDDEATAVLDVRAAPIDELDEDASARRGAALIAATVLYVLLLTLTISVANGVAMRKRTASAKCCSRSCRRVRCCSAR